MNDAINVVTLAPCPFCNSPAEDDGLRPYRALGSSRLGHGYAIYCTKCDADMMVCYEDHTGVDREALAADLRDRWNARASTPKATVEAAIRADEREKCAKIADAVRAPTSIGRDKGRHHEAGAQHAASAIRGKQP